MPIFVGEKFSQNQLSFDDILFQEVGITQP
jgi:hypothetical protein